MRNNLQVHYFNAFGDSHRAMEVRTPDGQEGLAYVDLEADGSYTLLLFKPYEGTRRTITRKSLKGAQSVLTNHLLEDGHKLVPIPPTNGMWDRAIKTGYRLDFAENVYAGREVNYGSPAWHTVGSFFKSPTGDGPWLRILFTDGNRIDIEPRGILFVR